MADALDVAREAAWEVAAVERAVKRYREFAETADPASLPAGRRVLVETVRPVAAVIDEALNQAAKVPDGRPAPWHAPMLALKPEVSALVAVATALRASAVGTSRLGTTLPRYSRLACGALRDQIDYQRWAGGTDDEDLRRRWHRQNPNPDRRAWARFAGRMEDARSAPWPEYVRGHVGAFLAQALVDGAPEWFETARVGDGPENRNPLHILLTPAAVDRMMDVEARAEVARPVLLPMIVPPNPWRYVERDQ